MRWKGGDHGFKKNEGIRGMYVVGSRYVDTKDENEQGGRQVLFSYHMIKTSNPDWLYSRTKLSTALVGICISCLIKRNGSTV